MKEPELLDYMSAGYPCLFLRTSENTQAAEALVRSTVESYFPDVMLGVWKVTSGLVVEKHDGSSVEKAQDLIDALAFVETSDEPIVAVFHNVRQFISNYAVIQQMSDSIMSARLVGSHIILLGPDLDLPPELRNLVTFIDLPLPSREEIEEEYRKIITAYEADIKLNGDKEELIRAAANAAVGLDRMGAENAIALSLATSNGIDLRVIQLQKENEVRKSELDFVRVEETLNDVGGFSALKEWLQRRKRAFSDKAREYGLPYPKGILIVGPAGTGKSLVAKATASYLQLPCLRLDMGKMFRSLVGESEATVRSALQVAEAVSPVVLWIDEIEKGLAGARGSGELDSGVTARVVSTILTWLQETKKPVMLVATANDVTTLPSMVYRKGRLDEVWATDLPTVEEREEIFEIHLRKRGRDPENFDIPLLAARTEDFVGAEIEGVIVDAMFSAFDKDREFTTKDILRSVKETVPQAQRSAEEVKATREWVKTRARLVGGSPTESSRGKVRKLHKK